MQDDTELEELARMILAEHASLDDQIPGGCHCNHCTLCRMVLAPLDSRPRVRVGSSTVIGYALNAAKVGDTVEVMVYGTSEHP